MNESKDPKAPLLDELQALVGWSGAAQSPSKTKNEDHTTSERDILQCVIESMSDGLVVADINGHFLRFNEAAKRIIGIGPADVAIRDWSRYYGCYLPDKVTLFPSSNLPLARAIRGENVDEAEVYLRNDKIPDGVYLSVNARPLRDTNGDIIGGIILFRDVTANKEAEDALQRSRREIVDLFENAAVGLHCLGPDGIILRANRTELDMLGYTREEYVGHHLSEFHVEPELAQEVLDRLKSGKPVGQYEARLKHRDGSIVHVVVDSNALWQDGEFIHTRSFTRNVTESKRTEALKLAQFRVLDLFTKDVPLEAVLIDLAESIEQRISGVVSTILLLDEDAQCLRLGVGPSLPDDYLQLLDKLPVNIDGSACGRAACTNEEQFVEDVTTDPRCAPLADTLLSFGLKSCRCMPISSQTGRVLGVFTAYLTSERWPDESLMQWVRSAVRIAGLAIERQRTLDTLRESEERFRLLVEGAQDHALFMLDTNGCIASWNDGAKRITGYRANEIVGRNFSQFYSPADLENSHPTRDLEAAQRDGHFEDEGWRLRKDGSEFWANVVITALYDKQGNLRGYSNVTRDITERRRSEEKLLQSERLAAIGEALTGLAHESRNAFQRSQANLERLRFQFEDRPEVLDLAPKTLELLSKIQQTQTHIQNLYEEVRDYAAPITLDRQKCNLRKILLSTWEEQLASERNGRDASLRQNETDLELGCEVDAMAIEQVFRNILENSLSVCEDPLIVDVEWSEATITGHEAIQIRIRNNGRPLNYEEGQRIFEPFYTNKTRGTGLGMTIAKRLIDAHGGSIRLGRRSISGAEFIVTVPRLPS